MAKALADGMIPSIDGKPLGSGASDRRRRGSNALRRVAPAARPRARRAALLVALRRAAGERPRAAPPRGARDPRRTDGAGRPPRRPFRRGRARSRRGTLPLAARLQSRAVLAGQIAGPLFLRPGRAIDLFAIRFEPWGAAALLGLTRPRSSGGSCRSTRWSAPRRGLVDALAAAASRRLASRPPRAGCASGRHGTRRLPRYPRGSVRSCGRSARAATPHRRHARALAGTGRRELDRASRATSACRPSRSCASRGCSGRSRRSTRGRASRSCRSRLPRLLRPGPLTREFGAVTGTTPARFLRERRGLETLLYDPSPPAAAVTSRV